MSPTLPLHDATNIVGADVGEPLGDSEDGVNVGDALPTLGEYVSPLSVGLLVVGLNVGDNDVGATVGDALGDNVVGAALGDALGLALVGDTLGDNVDPAAVGPSVGDTVVGELVGDALIQDNVMSDADVTCVLLPSTIVPIISNLMSQILDTKLLVSPSSTLVAATSTRRASNLSVNIVDVDANDT